MTAGPTIPEPAIPGPASPGPASPDATDGPRRAGPTKAPNGDRPAQDVPSRLLDDRGEVIEDVRRDDVERMLRDGRPFWLDLPRAGEEELMWLRDVFHFHPLAVEDAETFGDRPKMEEYDGYATLVLYGSAANAVVDAEGTRLSHGGQGAIGSGPIGVGPASAPRGAIFPDEIGALSEVHVFLSETYLVTVHERHCPAFGAMLARAHARKVPVTDTSQIFYRVADTLVDSFFPVLSELDDRIDTLQGEVIQRPDNSQLGELLSYRGALISLRRVITPQRDLFATLSSQVADLPGFSPDEIRYLRDVYDHLIRLSDMIDGYRDLLSGTTDAYLSVVSNQLNVVMKQLTIISTVFLPLAFITGFFGQNFGWMVNHIGSWEVFVGFGLGTELVAVGLLVLLFRNRGWIGPKSSI
jgi:magnesium transporter